MNKSLDAENYSGANSLGDETMKRHARVLYVMDSEFSEFETLKQILDLAEEYQLELTLFDIAQTVSPSARLMVASTPLHNLKDCTLRHRQKHLEALVSMIGPRTCKLRARTSFGNRAKEIVSETAQGIYELVIKRPEKGSTDRRVLDKCRYPVWVLKPEDYTESGQIIASNAPRIAPRNDSRTARICMQGI